MNLTNIVKSNKVTSTMLQSDLSSTERSVAKAEQQKIALQKQTRKKYLGNSMATN